MKTIIRWIFCCALVGASALLAQETFTRITSGAIVEDASYSSGPAWGDYNGDGWVDLFVADGLNTGAATVQLVYRNNGDGTFTRVEAAEGGDLATDTIETVKGQWADFDNDGDLDMFIGSVPSGTSNRLYVNDGGGHFTRVAANVGINSFGGVWGSACGDFDNDGFVDVCLSSSYVGGYPTDRLMRNQGDGTFVRCTTIPFRNMLNIFCAWGDADDDGDLDLFAPNNQSGSHAFYRNNGDGRFIDDMTTGLGSSGSAVIPVWGDFDNDGDMDIILTRHQAPCFYFQNLGDGTFVEDGTRAALQTTGLGAAAGDYDNDGDLDLFIPRGQWSGERSYLLENDGAAQFTSVVLGSFPLDTGHFTGGSWADYDNDGDLDLFVATTNNERNALYRNEGNANHWLIVRLKGIASNAAAMGAKVRIQTSTEAGPLRQMRQITGGNFDDLRAHFGLGDATQVDLLRIEWPSGIVQELTNVPPNQVLTVTEHQEGATNAPSLAMSNLTDGTVQLTATGQADLRYVFEASTDLAQWTKLAVRTNLTGTVNYTPPTSAALQRFYRVVLP
jgi:enediyne biosynthesis protein E4